jgi:hypothetical protein
MAFPVESGGGVSGDKTELAHHCANATLRKALASSNVNLQTCKPSLCNVGGAP